jgi:hypothetical protein
MAARIMSLMIKTQVYLPENELAVLRHAAGREAHG